MVESSIRSYCGATVISVGAGAGTTSGDVAAGGSAGTAMVGSGVEGIGFERGIGVGRELMPGAVVEEVVVVIEATDTPVWASARRRFS